MILSGVNELPISLADAVTLSAYFGVMGLLAVLGLHRLYLVRLFLRVREQPVSIPAASERFPFVTVQLPLYNERFVVEGLIEAVCRLDYPREKLEIQVLDDSTDDTTKVARAQVERMASLGAPIRLLHRDTREGYKAGALRAGLEQARGELIAVFDADFLPAPDFLRHVTPYFADSSVGCVQARWSYRNRDESLLTRVQGMLLDGHFVIEQVARSRSGRFFNFNGTAGVLRRRMIEQSGGWQLDTLTEDTDLSYRGQLAGWRMLYLPEVTVESELPPDMASFQGQQARWAKGLVQTGLKLWEPIRRADLPTAVKTEAFFHFGSNLSALLMALLAALLLPASLVRHQWQEPWLLPLDLLFFLATFGSMAAFWLLPAVVREGRLSREAVMLFPAALAVGVGLLLSNTRAVVEALAGVPSPFQRTAKYSADQRRMEEARATYRPRGGWLAWANLSAALYFGICGVYLGWLGAWPAIPFFVLFIVGHSLAAAWALWEGWQSAPRAARLEEETVGSSAGR